MFFSVLRNYHRRLVRHPLRALIDIGGLGLGIAAFLVLSLFVRFETSYEGWFGSADAVYVVRNTWTIPGTPETTSSTSMGGLLDQLRGDFDGLAGTRVWPADATVRSGGTAVRERAALVDPSFFSVFDWPLVAGDPARALTAPDGVVVTETLARTYFGTASAIGRTMTIGIDGRMNAYRVTGVLRDLPRNSMFHPSEQAGPAAGMLLRIGYDPERQPNWYNWGSEQLWTFLRFPDQARADAFEAQLPAFMERHARSAQGVSMGSILKQSLLPIRELHLIAPADRITVAALGIVGLLTLLIAVANYTNLATARAALRAREVAMRKVLGATRGQLVIQFIGEAILTVTLAAILGLTLTEFALPLVNAVGGTSLAITYFGGEGVILPLVLLVLVAGSVAGAYPAFVISAFQPAAVLASAQMPAGGRGSAILREILVGLQFAAAIAFAIVTVVLLEQARHVRAADLGFRRDGLIVVRSLQDPGLTPSQRSTLLDSFRRIPGVVRATQSDGAPGDSSNTNSMSMRRPDGVGPGPTITWINVGPDYFDTYDIRLLAGRALSAAYGMDDAAGTAGATSAVINRTALASFGFREPRDAIGQTVIDGDGRAHTIVGVAADVRFRSPRDPIPPTMYFFRPRDIENALAAVRFESADAAAIIARLRTAWVSIAPDVPFDAVTAEANLTSAYWRGDEQRSGLFAMGSLVAVVIGCVGLYGLASFSAARRVREIGIRKTLGASTADIARLLMGQLIRPVVLANLAAWPLAFFVLRAWLDRFDDRVEISILYFLLATGLAVAIAGLTVLGRTLKLARTEPGQALRHE